MVQIFSQRLKSARVIKGWSMDQLCKELNGIITKQSISKYEKGLMMPESSVLISLANALDVTIDYLFRPYNFKFPVVDFRKKSKLGIKAIKGIKEVVRDNIEKYFEIEDILQINNEFNLQISSNLIRTSIDVKSTALQLRSILGLGDDGISNVVAVLEENNIKVIELDLDEGFDGLSGYINSNKPIIVVNKNFVSERIRFTALHELGHLILNFDEDITIKQQEAYCNLFASEMLIPSNQFIKLIGNKRSAINLNELYAIQKQFGISVDALMYKANELKIISEKRYLGYCIKKNKYNNIAILVNQSRYPLEFSERFSNLVYRALSSEIISISKASSLLNNSVSQLQSTLNYI